MPGIYSERFLGRRAGQQTDTYTVPHGKRAVVRFITFGLWHATDSCFAVINGVAVTYFYSPDPNASVFWEVRLVAYAGEQISVQHFGTDASWHLDGFLFDDPARVAVDVVQVHSHELEPLSGPVAIVGPLAALVSGPPASA